MESFRRRILRFVDFLRGSSFVKTMQNIDLYHSDKDMSHDIQLKHLLDHATKTVKFYEKLVDYKSLNEFPVVNKNVIKSNFTDFISNKYKLEDLYSVTTSGSTGTPFKYYFDKKKKERRTIEVIYYNGWAGYEFGDKHILNAVGGKKSKLKLFMQNEILTNPLHLNGSWLENQRNLLLKKNVRFYVGYASALDRFASYCKQKKDVPERFHIKGIIAAAEKLNEKTRKTAKEVFGCPVLSRYGSLETGVLSQECPEKEKHHINTASYHIELLALHSDEPVKYGEIGRVVVTDLFSYGMPLIRYDIGDLAVLSETKCDCGRVSPIFERLEGRLVENVLDVNGNLVSWIAINDALWPFNEIQEFQFIQNSKNEYILNLKSLEPGKNIKKVEQLFKVILGDSIDLKIRYVDHIPSEKSGKTPYIINNYLK